MHVPDGYQRPIKTKLVEDLTASYGTFKLGTDNYLRDYYLMGRHNGCNHVL